MFGASAGEDAMGQKRFAGCRLREFGNGLAGLVEDGLTLSECAAQIRMLTGVDFVYVAINVGSQGETGRARAGTAACAHVAESAALRYLVDHERQNIREGGANPVRLCCRGDADASALLSQDFMSIPAEDAAGPVRLIPIPNRQHLLGVIAVVESDNAPLSEETVSGLQRLAKELGSFPADVRKRMSMDSLMAFYRELVEEGDGIILRRTPEGVITFLNRYGLKFFGYELNEVLGRHVVGTIVPSKDSAGKDLEAMIQSVGCHPDRYAYNENENIRKNGERVWIAWRNRFVRDEHGKVSELICVGDDLTDRRNAERALQSESALRKAIEKSMRPGITIFDLSGRVTYVNAAFIDMMGWEREELLGCGAPYCFVADADNVICPPRAEILMRGVDASTRETLLRRKGGDTFWGLTIGAPLQSLDEETIGWVVSVADLTEQKRASERLARLNECFVSFRTDPPENIQKLVEVAGQIMGARCAVYNRLRDGRLERAGAWGDATCVERQKDAAGHVCTDYVQQRVSGVWEHRGAENSDDRYCALVKCPGDGLLVGKCVGCGEDFAGALCLAYDAGHPSLTAEETRLLGVIGAAIGVEEVRNSALTDLVAHRTRLRAMTSQLVMTEQRERRRIAAILHDEVGQLIATACMRLAAVPDVSASGECQRTVKEIVDILRKAATQTRSLTSDLSLHVLYTIGLSGALGEIGDRVNKQHGIVCDVECEGSDADLGEDLKILVFHVVRELLFNVVKHAKAKHVIVRIATDADGVIASVDDDGVGFSPSVLAPDSSVQRGFGLYSVSERLQHIGGSLRIDSKPGKGAVVTVAAPLGSSKSEKPPARK